MKILLLVSVISVMINIMIILPYINLYSAKIRDKLFLSEYFSTNDPDSIMLDKVLETTCNIGSTRMPLNDPRGLFKDLKSFYGPSRHQSINNYYTSYALVGASYYAMYINDSTTMKCIKKKMDNYIDIENSALNYSINTVDQTPIGIIFLNLYRYYRKDIFDKYGDRMKQDLGYYPVPGSSEFTWERYIEVAKWMAENIPKEEIKYPTITMSAQHSSLFVEFSNIFNAYGGEYFLDQNNAFVLSK